jgi:predicted AAA+ superfamily ATPase
MRAALEALYSDFLGRALPEIHERDVDLEPVPGKALALIGMRRVGKTYACYQRMRTLLASGMNKSNLLYLNFEDDRLYGFALADCQTILDVFYQDRPEKKSENCVFFFDEIQNVPGWERFVRRLLDTESVTIYVTGSSAKLLSSEIATGLRGRSLDREIFPYSFHEYLRVNKLRLNVERPDHQTRLKLVQQAGIYCRKGGLPELQPLDTSRANEVAQSYVDAVVLRDVVERHGVSNVEALRSLLHQVLHRPTQKLSVNKLYLDFKSRGLRIAKDDLYALLRHLSDAFLIFQLPLWTHSEKKRQVNPKKIYVIDNGILAAYATPITPDNGAFLENLVYLTLRRLGLNLGYHITNHGHEIDFVFRSEEKTIFVQACLTLENESTRQREMRALIDTDPESAHTRKLIVTLRDEWIDNSTGIEVLPLWKFLLFTKSYL